MSEAIFDYCSTKSLNGIVRSFYDQGNLWANIQAQVSSNHSDGHFLEDVFNFDNSKYWIGNDGVNTPAYLIFCFKNHYVAPTGFEMKTSTGKVMPRSFAFYSSNDKVEWHNKKNYSLTYKGGESHYFSFKSPPSKCFKLECLLGSNDAPRFDVVNLDLFGEIRKELHMFQKCTQSFYFINLRFHYFLMFLVV